jgi:hypothetical protein
MKGMFCVLQSEKTRKFFSMKDKKWVDVAKDATMFRKYNFVRFIVRWYVEKKYEPVTFHNVLYLKADFKILDVIKQSRP